MSWPNREPARSGWRADVFQDAARIWNWERPSLQELFGAFVQDAGLAAAFLFRFSARMHRKGHPLLAMILARMNLALHGCQISFRATLGPGLKIAHPVGLVVGQGVSAGRDLNLFQNVTLGSRGPGKDAYPVIGDGVIIYPNSLVLGGFRVGDGARILAGSVVLHEVAPGTTVAGAPAAVLHRTEPIRRDEERGVK